MRLTLHSLFFALILCGCGDAPEEKTKPEEDPPSSQTGLSKGSALVLTLEGKVTVFGPSDANGSTAQANQFISPGDSLVTGPDSEALLLLTNGTTLSVGANTTFGMKAFYQADFEDGNAKVGALEEETSDSSVLLDLKAGDLVVDVKKLRKKSNFEISTPVGVAGIRGTTFKLIASAESTTLSVLTGRVDFVSSSKESFQVEASQGVLAPKGGNPKVSPLTEVQKQAIKATVDKARAKADEVDIGTLKDGLGFKNHLVPSASNLEMIWVEPGTFMMGSPPAEEGRNGDETRHRVTLTTGFYLGKHEVTQAQYKAVTGLNPSKYKAENRPVENVRWGDAFRFCSKLTNREQNAGTLPMNWKYALPTEAEWEYACRAGTSTVFSFGNRLTPGNASFTDIQPYGGNATGTKRGKTLEVGKFAPNPWGFHDMHGNVWEWVADIYRPFSNEVAIDPQGGPPGAIRVRRGGAFNGPASTLRSSNRKSQKASNKIFSLGFRLALKKAK